MLIFGLQVQVTDHDLLKICKYLSKKRGLNFDDICNFLMNTCITYHYDMFIPFCEVGNEDLTQMLNVKTVC